MKKRVLITGGKSFFGTRFREAHHHQFEILSTDVGELNILEKEKVQDADKPRDARLNTEKIRRHGFKFSSSGDAIRKCITEYGLRLT